MSVYFKLIYFFRGQKQFGKFPVDLFSAKTKEIFQFNGCLLHGHLPPLCTDSQRQKFTRKSAKTLFKKSIDDLDKEQQACFNYLLKNHGDQVSSIKYVYECDWNSFKMSNEKWFYLELDGIKLKQMTNQTWKEFLMAKSVNVERPLSKLNPRVAMRGGLLDQYNLMWLKKDHPDQIFKVADVNALYSHVTIENPFPVGRPEHLIGTQINEVKIQDCEIFYQNQSLKSGLIHCSILAPQNELIPILQFRVADQYNYISLCRLCAVNLKTKCLHRVSKSKCFTSVWTLPDILKALRDNYVICDIFEVHFFRERKFILRPFIQCLSSLRLKNSGGLDHLNTAEEKMNYCKSHNDRMQLPAEFALNVNNVIKNDRKKLLFKTLSNSLFGKFSQHSRQNKIEIVRSQHRLEEIASSFEILQLYELTETSLFVEYSKPDISPCRKTNIYIASEINSLARIFIHDKIKLLQNIPGVTIYSTDTDSIFYSIPRHVPDPLIYSDAIGDFKSLVPKHSEVIAYYSLGCRNYSILYQDESGILKSTIKCKGLSLNSTHLTDSLSVETYDEFLKANFNQEMKSLTLAQIRQKTKKPSFIPETNLQTFEFRNDLFIKRYVKKESGSYQTFPYGYKPNKPIKKCK